MKPNGPVEMHVPVETIFARGSYLSQWRLPVSVEATYSQWKLPLPVELPVPKMEVPVPVKATCSSGGYLCQ
jgi:hypothetical protein